MRYDGAITFRQHKHTHNHAITVYHPRRIAQPAWGVTVRFTLNRYVIYGVELAARAIVSEVRCAPFP